MTLAERVLEAIEAAEQLVKVPHPYGHPQEESWHTLRCGADWGSQNDECECHVPAAVLRHSAADRKTIEQWVKDSNPWEGLSEAELHSIAQHPAYEYATTEGQRKAWIDENVPPEGEGWERNTDRGRNGWERYDYTEESYWRRLRPEGPLVRKVPYWIANLAEAYGVPLEQEET